MASDIEYYTDLLIFFLVSVPFPVVAYVWYRRRRTLGRLFFSLGVLIETVACGMSVGMNYLSHSGASTPNGLYDIVVLVGGAFVGRAALVTGFWMIVLGKDPVIEEN